METDKVVEEEQLDKEDIKIQLDEIDAVDLTKMIIKHEDDIREVMGDVRMIAHFVKRVKSNPGNQFLKYFSDKEYVIVGVVIIAICAIFLIPDPANILMSIVSGLFGLGTGRAMSLKDLE